jgi:hypothetical protein
MVENMQHHSVKLCTLVLVVVTSLAMLVVVQPATTRLSLSAAQEYCNEQYTYCVTVPSSGKLEAHEGDAPNHGATIELSETGNKAWTYAHWDAALLGSSQKAALSRLEMLLDEHPNAEVIMRPTMVANMSAYRIRLSYEDTQPMTEELVISYCKPKNESQGPGTIYEIGLHCSQRSYAVNVSVLEALIYTFRRVGK